MSEENTQAAYTGEGQGEKHPVWTKVKRVLIFWSILLLFLSGIVLGFGAFIINALQPIEIDEEVTFVIESGTHSSTIADKLEEAGLIRNAMVFKYYLRFIGEGHRFQAGEYAIPPGITLDELIEKFNNGDTVQADMIRFTLPEGFTVEQIAEVLDTTGLATQEQFLQLMSDPSLFADTLVSNIPESQDYKYALEGYIFPETYEVTVDSTPEDVIRRTLNELDRKLSTLPEDWEQQLDVLGVTFHEMLTIASLVEREVVVDSERALVAGVIYNRLKNNHLLQIDASVQYALGEHQNRVLNEDLEVDSPYNTYENVGLPPGPIASPGIKSIEAALYPQETDYMFYVTKKDGTSEHYFAVTYQEHQANIAKSNENAKQSSE